jgi:ketosteroid isomerase-like protein
MITEAGTRQEARMSPSTAERDALFKTFGRAWFRRDAELLYEAVTPDFVWASTDGEGDVRRITGRNDVAAALAATGSGAVKRRFEDVVYHHAPDATFMTFRLIETDPQTGVTREEAGIERYTFKDGRIALKDVYRKLAG